VWTVDSIICGPHASFALNEDLFYLLLRYNNYSLQLSSAVLFNML
jgi:hypothetical protein